MRPDDDEIEVGTPEEDKELVDAINEELEKSDNDSDS